MKRFAMSAILAGGLFAGALGMAGTAAATELYVGPGGAGVTSADGSGFMVGPDGVRVLMPQGARDYDGRYYDQRYYDGRYYDQPYYGQPYYGQR